MQNTQSPPVHFGQSQAGQSHEWMHSDNQDSYQRMMADPVHRAYFAKQGWDQPNSITYNINSEGFRGSDFDTTKPGMIALGCSFTFGTGLPIRDIWPTLVAHDLGLECWNLAWPGSAADTCFRLAEYWIPRLQPSLVCMLTPPRDRFELITGLKNLPVEVFMSMSESQLFSSADIYLKHWFAASDNAYVNQRKNTLAIQALCTQLQIPFVVKHADQEMSSSREQLEYARDYMHAGPLGHRLLTEKILNDYRTKTK